MADVWQVTAKVLDGQGKSSPISFYLLGTLTAAQAKTAAENVLAATVALCEGAITEVKIALNVDTTAWTLPAVIDPQSNRQYKARFMFSTDDGFISRVSVPCLDEAAVADNSEALLLGAGDPAKLFETAFLAESTVDERGTALTTLLKAYEVFGQ